MTDYSIWPATDGPLSSFDDGVALNVGTEFFVSTTAWVTHLRWWRGTTNVNADNLRLYRVDSASSGTMLAEVTSPAAAGTGWQVSTITPIQLTAGVRYKVVAHMPTHYVATGGYWASGGPGDGGIVNGVLTAPDTANADGGGQGTFKTGAVAFPDGSFNGGNYWVDIILTNVDPSGGIVVVLDLAVETDTAHAGTPAHAVPLALATELDSGQALTVVKTVPLPLAVQTDTALLVAAGHVVPLDLATEVDTAHAVGLARSVTLGLAVETDTAFPITIPGVLLVPGTHVASSTTSQLAAASSVARLEAW